MHHKDAMRYPAQLSGTRQSQLRVLHEPECVCCIYSMLFCAMEDSELEGSGQMQIWNSGLGVERTWQKMPE